MYCMFTIYALFVVKKNLFKLEALMFRQCILPDLFWRVLRWDCCSNCSQSEEVLSGLF